MVLVFVMLLKCWQDPLVAVTHKGSSSESKARYLGTLRGNI